MVIPFVAIVENITYSLTISTSTFQTDTMIIGKRYIENKNGSLVQTPITRQMPLRIKLISLDAFEHTERTITNMYLDGIKALTIPTKTKKQSLFLEVNNNKYQYTKEVNTTGKLVAQKVYKNDNIIITTQYQYDKVRPIKETINNFETNYTYDDMGNITSKINPERINIYTYDSLGRLSTHNNGTNIRTYVYDFEGNIIRVLETQDNTLNVYNDIVYKYEYSDNRLESITRQIGQNSPVIINTLTYDDSSSSYPSKINGVSLTWNKGKLTSYGNNTYEYNLLGQRTKKTTQTHIHEYTYDDNLLVKEKITNKSNNQVVVLEYIYDQQNILIGVVENNNVYYYDRDITGEIRGLIDTNGNYVIKYYYTAFGEVTKEPNNITNFNPFLYKGYYYDEETKLFYCNSRYYSPELCRFISPDDVGYLDPSSINGLNLYSYCYNNPISYYDPSGHMPEWLSTVGRVIGGMLISAASIGLIAATIRAGGWFCLLPGYGTLLQTELSLLMYGGFMMASSWDPLIQSDMEAIYWNPFNSNPDMSYVNKVSFYKGETVILQDFAPSSFSYEIMFLHKNDKTSQDTVKHEWGHFGQMFILGPAVFTAFVAAPSLIYNLWGDYQNYKDYRYYKLYYSKIWERTADMLGGVNRNNYYDFWNIRNFMVNFKVGVIL